MQIPRIRGVLLDLDGLLLDTERVSLAAWRHAEKDTGMTLPDAFYDGIIGQNMPSIRASMAMHIDDAGRRESFLQLAHRHYCDRLQPGLVALKPGATELLDYLEQSATPHALATSTQRPLVDLKLASAGLNGRIPLRICGDEVSEGKPHPEIFTRAAAALALDPAVCLALEDSENGIRSAHAAGCLVGHVPDLASVAPAVRTLIWRVFPDLHAVLGWLRGENAETLKR
jgi:HAD superfamily hydrolase (TIGR01509 family)